MSETYAKRILVVGATGGVGRFICPEVVRQFGTTQLVVGDHKAERGREFARDLGSDVAFRPIDVTDTESVSQALEGMDAVIVAVQQREPIVQASCIARRIPCLDITVQPQFIAGVNKLDSRAISQETASIVMAGLFPGLSGIMVKYAVEGLTRVDTIDVGLLQNAQATTGATGVADMLGLFAQPVWFKKGGEQFLKPGFTVTKIMIYPEPFGQRTQRLVNFAEAAAIAAEFDVKDVNYWTSFDSSNFDFLLALLNRIGFLKLFNHPKARMRLAKTIGFVKGLSKPVTETIAVTVKVSNRENGPFGQVSLVGPSDYGTTATSVVAMTKLILQRRVEAKGVRLPLQVFPMMILLDAIDCQDLILHTSKRS